MKKSVYDEVDLEDMAWDEELKCYTYECPCGDLFQISPGDLRAGEEIARCPSCTLVVRVVYDLDDFSADECDSDWRGPPPVRCVRPDDH